MSAITGATSVRWSIPITLAFELALVHQPDRGLRESRRRAPDTVMRLFELAYLMLPAYVANMAPRFVKYWHGW